MPRWVDCQAGHLQVRPRRRVHRRAQDAAQARPGHAPTRCGSAASRSRRATWSPPCLPDPADARRRDDRQDLRRAAGSPGTGKDGAPARRRTSTTWSTTSGRWREYGRQCVVWQTAINPVVALELLAARHLVRRRRARPGGVRRGAVPRPAHRVRLAVGRCAERSTGLTHSDGGRHASASTSNASCSRPRRSRRSGGRKRSTLPYVPQVRVTTPACVAGGVDRARRAAGVGLGRARAARSSIAIIAPRPRTSPITGYVGGQSAQPRRASARRSRRARPARSWSASSSMRAERGGAGDRVAAVRAAEAADVHARP